MMNTSSTFTKENVQQVFAKNFLNSLLITKFVKDAEYVPENVPLMPYLAKKEKNIISIRINALNAVCVSTPVNSVQS